MLYLSGAITATSGDFTGDVTLGSNDSVVIDGANECIKVFGTLITIEAGVNDDLDWTEDGVAKAGVLTAGDYTPTNLAEHVQAVMRAVADDDTTCTYSSSTRKITIANSTLTTLTFLWYSGASAVTTCGMALGFVTTADDTGALTYSGDYEAALRVKIGKLS